MKCETVEPYLPWYLNDSLEEAEKEEIDVHLGSCASCGAALAATRRAFDIFDAHLPAPVLTDLAEGRTPAVSEAVARRHLASCERCAADFEMVEASRRAIEAVDEPDSAVTPFAPRPRSMPNFAALARPVAVAASLLALVATGGWLASARVASQRAIQLAELEERLEAAPAAVTARPWAQELERAQRQIAELEEGRGELARQVESERRRLEELQATVERARAPRPNVALVDLFPAAAITRGDGTQMPRIGDRERSNGWVLILNSQADLGAGPVRAELLDTDGDVAWSLAGLDRNSTGSFTLALPRLELPTGEYALRLTGDGGETETFPLRIDAP